jgi:hypothetical protein
MEWFVEIGIPVVGVLLAISIPLYLVIIFVRFKRKNKKSLASLEERSGADESPLCEIHGRVVEKHCYSGVAGTKNVRAYTCFYFLFLTDDGDTLRYEVDEETYLSIEEKTEGTVGVVGERFFGFCPDDTVN